VSDRSYQQFKDEVIAYLPRYDQWSLTSAEIRRWVQDVLLRRTR